MILLEIQKKLIKNGYLSTLQEDNVLVNGIKIGRDEDCGWDLMRNAFGIKLSNSKAILDYLDHQITIEKEFDDTEAMIKFIKKQFPL